MGFALIFGVTRTFNLAHGELILVSGYLAYYLLEAFEIPFLWTLPVCMLVLPAATVLFHLLLRYVREPLELNTLVLSFGLALVLQNGLLFVFSADYLLIPSSDSSLRLPRFDAVVSLTQIYLLLSSFLATTVLYLTLRKTYLGKALRATIQNCEAAALAGIPIENMRFIAFAMGGVLIGLAGPLFGQTLYLHPSGGMEVTFTAIVITIIAGIGSIKGILWGGWIIGLAETFTSYYLGASWREMVSALILIILLLWRPEGVLSQKTKLIP
jgi:branched-chain amino acid transport system permease protein